ncbi:uncharacterized protein [Nicotiana sylvestris]|uniref:uncharacterized protein n=1 Tax=Nicotiana sylvestris TaxID=4096 RepID=UPI00388C9817
MTNPQDNLGTPPPPTPSNSSTPPPPSTSPKPRLRRVKILARKTIASGALRKKLNEKLKAIQAQNSDSSSDFESYQSATEGEEPGTSNSEKTQKSPSKGHEGVEVKRIHKNKKKEGACGEERGNGKEVVPAICGVAQERVEESGMKSGGSGFGEAAEGLVHLSTQRDEPVSSTEETLADLLKKGRATRSRVKQSKADLQRALAESKKKKMDKGKGKIVESSEDVEEEEMELVHQERGTSVEVPTPKPNKPKTSSKKSSSVSEAVEPTLAKRTRFAVKNKKSKISEDDDWSGEEEENDSEKEQDKLAMFDKRKILKGRLLKDLMEPGIMRLVDALAA